MMNWVAAFLRSMNTRLVGEDRWIVQKFLKIFYGTSVLAHRTFKAKQTLIVIDNFDRDLKIKMDPSRSMGATIYWSGFHEFHEFLFLHKFLKKEMVFADVGANLGEYTLFVAKRLSQGTVLAFEPLPKMHALLEENIKLNHFKNVKLLRYGLSDQEGTLPILEIDDEHEGLSTFYPGDRKIMKRTEVPLKSFDKEFGNFGVATLDFIKMDIEGAELTALKGFKNTIEQFKPTIMVEINSVTFQRAGYSVDEMFQFFSDLHYDPFDINKQGDLEPCLNKPFFANIVFKPR
jgi:FkbM family methyltransferase